MNWFQQFYVKIAAGELNMPQDGTSKKIRDFLRAG